MKVPKVNIDELHICLYTMKQRGILYIDIVYDEENNKLLLIESPLDGGDTEIKLEDIV